MGVTFSFTRLAWVFFRSPSVGSALDYLVHMITASPIEPLRLGTNALLLSVAMMGWEWVQREKEHGLEIAGLPRPLRQMAYLGLIFLVIHYSDVQREFIYFQF